MHALKPITRRVCYSIVNIVPFRVNFGDHEGFAAYINAHTSGVAPLLHELNEKCDRETPRSDTEINAAKSSCIPRKRKSFLNKEL
jgi:hypothetical protein